ncbi:MAG: J domain-containing protein [Leptolyngbyaceae cyanobacterium SM1_3_5]|nr:J domain-containing protein [Leptolyngbyaceae cyanobacterium SM1_3_5]
MADANQAGSARSQGAPGKVSGRSGAEQASCYAVLGIHSAASTQQIRRAYRELSKLYHPDTTSLPPAIATAKFHQLNEAYAMLSSPDRRAAYDLKHGYSRFSVIQAPLDLDRPVSERGKRSSAYLEPVERPLSPGELFALFILGMTFVACLLLVVAIGWTRGEIAFHSPNAHSPDNSALEQVAPRPTAVESNLSTSSPDL